MITACELCAKIAVENALREEATRLVKIQTAKAFAEEILSPILSELTEIPDHLLIGYRYSNYATRCGMYRYLSDWSKGLTTRGNPKKERNLWGQMGESDFSMLDYEILNQYLAEFGFQISYDKKWLTMTEYSTSTRNTGDWIDHLYLSMTCPLEEC